jgi:hypothetical protein
MLIGLKAVDASPLLPSSVLGEEEAKPRQKLLKIWGEVYNESMSLLKDRENFISTSHVRQGLQIHAIRPVPIKVYFLARYGRDIHRDFWNNKVETGLGIRARILQKVFLALYAEWIHGFYTKIPEGYPQPGQDRYTDLRGGLLFWYGWDKWKEYTKFISFPLHLSGEVYSDISYFRSQKHNMIGYLHSRSGIRVLRIWKSSLDATVDFYVMKDRNNDFWNNKAEIGPGLWFKPVEGLDLKFFVEWLWGSYFGIEGNDPNPYAQTYRDRKFGITLWIGW